jgi:hypothetical protein
MQNRHRRFLSVAAAAVLLVTPSLAETKKQKGDSEEAGVREAIAFQRAKDRADAEQARKEARNPEKFTHAQPQPGSKLANEQKQGAVKKGGDAERRTPNQGQNSEQKK